MQRNELSGDRTMSIRPRLSGSLLCGLLAACFVLLTSTAAVAAPGEGAALGDGVVIDTGRSIAYVMHPKGGIQALDLATGASLWRSKAAERPLALAGNLLVAQARPGERGELRVVALDVRKRGAASAEADLPLPSGVRAEVAETVDRAFHVSASPSPQGFLVAWDSQAMPALPERSSARLGRGAGGASKAIAGGEPENLQGTALFDPRAGRLLPMKAADAQIVPLRPAVASLSSPAAAERLFASADGRHVLASRRVGNDTSPAPYRWTISDAASGAVLGTVRSAVSMRPFVVAGTRLIYVAYPAAQHGESSWIDEPFRLRAVDLATGREAWSRQIRDVAFRGPFPF
jgi:hypothetical protein